MCFVGTSFVCEGANEEFSGASLDNELLAHKPFVNPKVVRRTVWGAGGDLHKRPFGAYVRSTDWFLVSDAHRILIGEWGSFVGCECKRKSRIVVGIKFWPA